MDNPVQEDREQQDERTAEASMDDGFYVADFAGSGEAIHGQHATAVVTAGGCSGFKLEAVRRDGIMMMEDRRLTIQERQIYFHVFAAVHDKHKGWSC